MVDGTIRFIVARDRRNVRHRRVPTDTRGVLTPRPAGPACGSPDGSRALTLGVILVLLVFSAFFSGSETALTAASQARIHQMARKGNKSAATVQSLAARSDTLIGAILIGNNITNILASSLATSVLIAAFGETGVAYATVGMTLLVVISPRLPKTVPSTTPTDGPRCRPVIWVVVVVDTVCRDDPGIVMSRGCSASMHPPASATTSGKKNSAASSRCTKARARKSSTSVRCSARSSISATSGSRRS